MDGKEPVGKRLTRFKIVESIIEPNAEIDQKYLSTAISTVEGKTITGLLVSESKDEVVIFDGKEKRTIKTADIDARTSLKQSSMPEGLAAAMAPVEFLDIVAFLSSLK
jgi:putative heme-binding domain-containing protein